MDPTAYVLDGISTKMVPRTIEIAAQGADGRHETANNVDHGMGADGGDAPPGPQMEHHDRICDQGCHNPPRQRARRRHWIAMSKAQSVNDLRVALGKSGIPWVNTIAADRHGQAVYADLSVVPDVSVEQLQHCAPAKSAAALFASADIAVLDGSRSVCDWNHDPTAPVPGLIPSGRSPGGAISQSQQSGTTGRRRSTQSMREPDRCGNPRRLRSLAGPGLQQ